MKWCLAVVNNKNMKGGLKMGKKRTEPDAEVLEIDENRLDEEWINQPKNFAKFALKQALAKKRHEEAKRQLDVVRSELMLSVYKQPEVFGLDKVTEGRVQAVVLLQLGYLDAHDKMTRRKHDLDVYSAMVTALDHKKQALQSLVSLHGQNYFSSPVADAANAEKMDRAEQRAIARKGKKKKGGTK
jgi:hypothetical protein